MNNERRYVLKYNKKQIELMVKYLSRAAYSLRCEMDFLQASGWCLHAEEFEEEQGLISFIIDTLKEKIGEK